MPAASKPRRKAVRTLVPGPKPDAKLERWMGSIKSTLSTPVRGGTIRRYAVPLPVERTLELTFEFDAAWDGALPDFGDVDGARVKPVLFVPEELTDLVDREAWRDALLEAGATYVKTPTVHVVRRRTKRDERHAAQLSLEESLRIFAEETGGAPKERIEFAAALARDADAGDET